MKQMFCVLFCSLAFMTYSQEKDPEKVLNGLINKSVYGKGAFILMKNHVVIPDSTLVRKIDYLNKDSLVHMKFKDNRSLQVPKEEFWGLVTDYNERQRFYKDEIYIVWRTHAPYIYKNMATRNENKYYFSGTLTGSIYPLLPGTVETTISDTAQRRVLNRFVAEHKLGQNVMYSRDADGTWLSGGEDVGDAALVF